MRSEAGNGKRSAREGKDRPGRGDGSEETAPGPRGVFHRSRASALSVSSRDRLPAQTPHRSEISRLMRLTRLAFFFSHSMRISIPLNKANSPVFAPVLPSRYSERGQKPPCVERHVTRIERSGSPRTGARRRTHSN